MPIPETIPTRTLDALAQDRQVVPEVFFLDTRINTIEGTFDQPYRSNYYGLGVCTAGHGVLEVDLDARQIAPRTLIATPPEVVKQWRDMSPDFVPLAVFFTPSFLRDQVLVDPARFRCFQRDQVFEALTAEAAESLTTALRQLKASHASAQRFREEILRARITALLFEIEALYEDSHAPDIASTKGASLAREFKRLVMAHCIARRQVGFYADALAVTPRHLSTTVLQHTGRTASQWIHEGVVLEARVQLAQSSRTIAQIAEWLRFPDQSTFGKYFKQYAGTSPRQYREGARQVRTG